MRPLSQEEIRKAFSLWHYHFEFKKADERLHAFLTDEIKAYTGPGDSWLKQCRQAQLLSGAGIAKKLNVSRAAYAAYEESERAGKITLETLARAAEAMDCELIYALRPKERKSFALMLWNKLFKTAKNHGWLEKCHQKKRANALSAISQKLTLDPKFRKQMGWSKRQN